MSENNVFNPYTPEFRRDPYAVYRRLRSDDPVHFSALGAWVITRYDDVTAMLKSKQLSAELPLDQLLAKTGGDNALFRLHRNVMLLRDPPAHTRLRGLLAKAFTARSIDHMRPRIAALVASVLDDLPDPHEMEVLRDCAFQVPVMVICDMLGLPSADGMRLHAWSRELSGTLDLSSATAVRIRRWNQTIEEFSAYLAALIDERRRAPQEDLLSELLLTQDQDQRLSQEELIATCLFLFATSHETTTVLIANTILSLLRWPEQLARLRESPALLPAAIEETLRYESPLQLSSRIAASDIELRGKRIAASDRLLLCFGAAGRDPERFADPDHFDLTRGNAPHLAFGHGIHYCIGAQLARAETAAVLKELLARYSKLRLLTAEPRWEDNVSLRAVQELWIELS